MNETVTNATTVTTVPFLPVHSAGEKWAVAVVLVTCCAFLLTLVMVLFFEKLRKYMRLVGFHTRFLFCRVCCMPCSCCWSANSRWYQYIVRNMTRLEDDLELSDLGQTSSELEI